MSLVPLSFGLDENPPVILVHDISGSPFAYLPFGSHPSLAQYTIYGISTLSHSATPLKTHDFEYSSIANWAAVYAALIESELVEVLKADRRIILGGWSLGGILATEMARIFAQRTGQRVHVVGLLLIDTYAPWCDLLHIGPAGLEVGGVKIESAYFTHTELIGIAGLLGRTDRRAWPGLDRTKCPAQLITPSSSGANGLEEWLGNSGRIRRIGQGKQGCDHFSMMEKGWIEEVIAVVSDALGEMLLEVGGGST
ncbi:Alpha/Beta hydrolase protein [Mycena crocata]|nr:Alpha/Beta hydrolase protein [Mycena crocata]